MLQGVRQGEVGETGADPARMRLCTDIGNSAPVRDMGVQPPLSEVPAFTHHHHRAFKLPLLGGRHWVGVGGGHKPTGDRPELQLLMVATLHLLGHFPEAGNVGEPSLPAFPKARLQGPGWQLPHPTPN